MSDTTMNNLSSPLLSRRGQQSSPGNVHHGDAGEDVQFGAAGLLCVPVQPL